MQASHKYVTKQNTCPQRNQHIEFPGRRNSPFDPPPAIQALQEEAPLVRVQLRNGVPAWLVTRYAEQKALLSDPRVSSDVTRPGYPIEVDATGGGEAPVSFILMDDPEHARLRRMVTAPFMIKRVEAMRPGVQKIVDELIDTMLAGPKPVDLVQAFALPVPSLVICQLLGVPYSDHDFFQENSKTLINRDATGEERMAAGGRLFGYLDTLIGEKIAAPGDDLLSGLVERIEKGELSRPEAAQMGVLMLLAGHETTANMIGLGTLALLEHPDQLALLRDSDDPRVVASADEIAAAAGISVRTLWRYFPTKERCVWPLLAAGLQTLTRSLSEWPPDRRITDTFEEPTADATVDLDAMLALIRLTATEPGLRAVWLQAHDDAEPVIVAAMARRTALPEDDLRVKVRAALLNSALRAAVEHHASRQSADENDLFEAVHEALRIAAAGLPD